MRKNGNLYFQIQLTRSRNGLLIFSFFGKYWFIKFHFQTDQSKMTTPTVSFHSFRDAQKAKEIRLADLAKHDSEEDGYVSIHRKVYGMKFQTNF